MIDVRESELSDVEHKLGNMTTLKDDVHFGFHVCLGGPNNTLVSGDTCELVVFLTVIFGETSYY